jgi:protein-disulfide isomerase
LIDIRHGFVAAALAVFTLLAPTGGAMAQSAIAALLAKPVLLPDIPLGSAKAPVTIFEYASITCPHCAAFEQNVFPMLRSKYIDSGKVRFVFRAFPLDVPAAAASMLARCAANGDAEKYYEAIDLLFKQQDQLLMQTTDTLKFVGQRYGMDVPATEACVKEQSGLDNLSADQDFALKELKVDATPTFFINGTVSKGSMSFEELEEKLRPFLKR